MVRLVAPLLLNTRLFVTFNPFDTVPKLMAVGFTESCACELTAIADKLITAGALPPSPWTVSVPAIAPADVGLTTTVSVPVCPTASAIGMVRPAALNCGLENVAWVIFIPTLPVFETETLCVLCLPTPTCPKFTLDGLN